MMKSKMNCADKLHPVTTPFIPQLPAFFQVLPLCIATVVLFVWEDMFESRCDGLICPQKE